MALIIAKVADPNDCSADQDPSVRIDVDPDPAVHFNTDPDFEQVDPST